MKTPYERSKDFVYRNARPLDIARWRYHFEYGALSHVLKGLSHYQNDDGGFGHALEPDSWNPNSSPIQTWLATEILREINFDNESHPIIQGILMYLDSGKDVLEQYWANTVRTNNDYPHAPWWHYTDDIPNHRNPNPTAALVGFILKYANPHSDLYERAVLLSVELVNRFVNHEIDAEMHALLCFIRLHEALNLKHLTHLVDMVGFTAGLQDTVHQLITQDTSVWGIQYITKPSQFIRCPQSIFYNANKSITDFECEFILNTQLEDGSWSVPWGWQDYPTQWAISENWWKVSQCIENTSFLKSFDKL